MRVDEQKIDEAFQYLDDELALTFKKAAVEAHIAGDVKAQQQLGMKVSFKLIKSAATEYGREYSRLLTERGGGYVVEGGQLVFKDWFRQSSLANREKVAGIINDGIKEGRSVRDLKKDLKEFFNQRKNHAEMVARTETAKIQSIATRDRLIQQGIRKVQWITAEDERVRDEHAERHMQVYDVDNSPLPGSFNCRCTLIPYVEKV